jgi:hypothetical protein
MALNTGIESLDAGAPELRLEGEQQAGGPYNTGSDVKNALNVWSNMGPEDRSGFEGFLDFFRTGAWRDQIQGMRQMERDMRTAGPSSDYLQYVQAMNALGQEPMPIGIFQSLEGIMSVQDMVNMGSTGKAQGGRIGFADGMTPMSARGFEYPNLGSGESTYRASALSDLYKDLIYADDDDNDGNYPYTKFSLKEIQHPDFFKQFVADGGRIGRRGGGIMDVAFDEEIVGKPGGLVEPGVHQYGIFKKAKKFISKGVKKVKKLAKSKLGKLALAYAAYQFGPRMWGPEMGKQGWASGIARFRDWAGLTGTAADTAVSTMGQGAPITYARGPFVDTGGMLPSAMNPEVFTQIAESVKPVKKVVNPIIKKAMQYGIPLTAAGAGAYTQQVPGETIDERLIAAGHAGRGEPLIKSAQIKSDVAKYLAGELSEDEMEELGYTPSYLPQRAASGGRIGYRLGTPHADPRPRGLGGLKDLDLSENEIWKKIKIEELRRKHERERERYERERMEMPPEELLDMKRQLWENLPSRYAQGGRIGYEDGKGVMMAMSDESNTQLLESLYEEFLGMGLSPKDAARKAQEAFDEMSKAPREKRVMAQEGGLMNLGGMEKDYRQEGGFVPIGGEEKADDVPARLSKNEFVFTADAVRAAGGGDIDAGAEVMENVMENLEAGGEISEESQGLEGARDMFANAQELEKRII